ncbi:MAG: DNA repair protein RecO [Bacteroidales bacterium]|nr:DNA repair protein RecO [Bacteroidales bacterium]MDD4602748.1 DNA repair protein RecO [Bacteroidales bacterium]
MLQSTKGIVFHSIKFSETSLIVKIYTQVFGLQSYLFKGIRNPKSKIKPGLFQPLTLLDLVVYHRERKSIQSAKEIHLAHPFATIPFDIRKSSVLLFLNELLYKSIREEEPNDGLFEFLWLALIYFDELTSTDNNFHLFFCLQLCHHLGIFPQLNYSSSTPIFNLREGQFQKSIPDHPQYLAPPNSSLFYRLLCYSDYFLSPMKSDLENLVLTPKARKEFLETILLYYQLHLPGFSGVLSHRVLHDVLS